MESQPVLAKQAGVYAFWECEIAMYVGQTHSVQRRLREHTNPTSTENQASFAFLLAKEKAAEQGLVVAGTRKQRLTDPKFEGLFRESIKRSDELVFDRDSLQSRSSGVSSKSMRPRPLALKNTTRSTH